MTLRDWFAGQALAGWLAAPGDVGEQGRRNVDAVAEWSYEMADAMLAARAPDPREEEEDDGE